MKHQNEEDVSVILVTVYTRSSDREDFHTQQSLDFTQNGAKNKRTLS